VVHSNPVMFVKVKDNLNFIIKKTPAKLKTPVLDLRTPRKQGFHTSNGKKVTILQINIEDRVTFLLLTACISELTALFNFINQWPTNSMRTTKRRLSFHTSRGTPSSSPRVRILAKPV
jgi:hypothetical protein